MQVLWAIFVSICSMMWQFVAPDTELLHTLSHALRQHCWYVGQFDQLVCETMELLDRHTGNKLGLKRKRNVGEASLTLDAKRPSLCVLVRNALLFKGEDKTDEGSLDQAVAELKQKMRRWSRSYHGQVDLFTCVLPCVVLRHTQTASWLLVHA